MKRLKTMNMMAGGVCLKGALGSKSAAQYLSTVQCWFIIQQRLVSRLAAKDNRRSEPIGVTPV